MAAETLPPIGFIGLGDQGLPMAVAIAEAGYPLHVWARRPDSLSALGTAPHVQHADVEGLGAACDIVGLCVSTDQDVMQLVTGGLLDGLRPGSVLVNHGTGTPQNALRLAETCARAGVEVLDAPVSGARAGAEARTLTTMVGGPEPVAQRCDAVFRSFSRNVVYLGEAGSGQIAKLFNNTLLMMNQASIAEIVELATDIGADPIRLAEVVKLASGSSAALTLLPTHTQVPADVIQHLANVQTLDMELFDTAMIEAGADADAVTKRGLIGAGRLPELVHRLNP